jgi:predicted nucleic acid-binding protein
MSDNTKRFLDTNVLIYAFAESEAKAEAAEAALRAGGVVSVQVLNEFTHVCSRKLKLSWVEIEERRAVIKLLVSEITPITLALHDAAVDLARAHQFSFYDALIVAAAQSSGCTVLLSEDLHHGWASDGLRIENPFRMT